MGRAGRPKCGAATMRQAPRSTARERQNNFKSLTAEKLAVHYLQDDQSVRDSAKALENLAPESIGLDFETASKNGKYGVDNGALRLIQIGIDTEETGPQQIVVDCFRANPQPFMPLLRDPGVEKQIHNMAFEQEWSQVQLGARIRNVYDTCLAFRVIQDKLKSMDEAERESLLPGWKQHDNRLATLLRIYLDMEMPKDGQVSDWSRETLQPGQIVYAAMDAAVMPLITQQVKRIAEHVGCEEAVTERINNEDRKINDRVRAKKRNGEDDSTRVERAISRAASLEELERLWDGRRQMTIFADSKGSLREAYKNRRRQLLGSKRK